MKPKKLYSISWIGGSINNVLEELVKNCPDDHKLGLVGLNKTIFLKIVANDLYVFGVG